MARINDGRTRPGYFREFRGYYPAVTFEWRRASLEEQIEWGNKYAAGDPAERVEFGATFLAQKLVGWDLKNERGVKVPLTAANLRNPDLVDPNLFSRFAAVILGLELPDQPPGAAPADAAEAANLEKEAAVAGVPVGAIQDRRDEKN